VSVLMRYTLRLLTLDQLGRAATLMCALELERQADVEKLGEWPFEIGLWVGQAATPNRMGKKGDNDRDTARARTIAFKNDDRKPSPIPIENCPWCGEKFTRDSFKLLPNIDHPTDLRVHLRRPEVRVQAGRERGAAADRRGGRADLPPAALLPHRDGRQVRQPPVGGRDGRAPRQASSATTSEASTAPASPVLGPLLERIAPAAGRDHPGRAPPHLRPARHDGGPLRDRRRRLCERRDVGGEDHAPKVVASTATVRRAEAQIRALFGRRSVEVFPPPGPDRRDSFFATTVPARTEERARTLRSGSRRRGGASRSCCCGRTSRSSPRRAAPPTTRGAAGGRAQPRGPVHDAPRVLQQRCASWAAAGASSRTRCRSALEATAAGSATARARGPFAHRTIAFEPLELTSRESTAKVADTKRRLGLAFAEDERVDVALATNMISVGLDITRLGLMVVLGQPKTTSEYIQATSRVGRDDTGRGWSSRCSTCTGRATAHTTSASRPTTRAFYRSVEATSVTPFSPRAIDRGLAGVTVALARHGLASLTAPQKAVAMEAERKQLDFVADELAERAARHDHELPKEDVDLLRSSVRARVGDLLDAWGKLAHAQSAVGAGLQYQREEGGTPPLLRDPLDPELATIEQAARKFKAHRSLRDVEPNVQVWIRTLAGDEVEHDTVEDDE
jgi:hypothetical protein